MKTIRCIFCSTKTTLHNINVQKVIRGKVITISNAPVFYCKECDETFLAHDTMEAYKFIKASGLDNKKILFSFDEIMKLMMTESE
jgi:YgiT-type zinc finger domain-containing protein